MKAFNSPKRPITLLSTAFIALLFACNEEQALQQWTDEAEALRNDVEKQIEVTPYRQEQQEAFQKYFARVGELADRLKTDSSFNDQFNSALARSDIGEICRRDFVTRADWSKLNKSCSKGPYFLCSEEVRSYPSFLEQIRKYLRPELQERLNASESCRLLPWTH